MGYVTDIIQLMYRFLFLCLIPIRHYAKRHNFKFNSWQMIVAGGVLGYITGVVFSTGPLLLPVLMVLV